MTHQVINQFLLVLDTSRFWLPILFIMPFWGFRADFKYPKGGSKSARTNLKRHNAIELRLKKRKKLRRLDCVSATQFMYAFSTVVQLLIVLVNCTILSNLKHFCANETILVKSTPLLISKNKAWQFSLFLNAAFCL